ncbi:conjugal transfer protein TraI [Dyadobacter psychrotolerans]|uniref:Conjugal transfer protein TraI n=1 Tax=Dyadobacter psychrotolerans TaxID=2541721 RepID=A0A4R5DZR4_9BACT|nr:conjugal transfer protein TraI [Dyadobacter psychrotolerans]TDE18070.1 conjugal transfer protein TraI [Dyadobacter psychrotolerans]
MAKKIIFFLVLFVATFAPIQPAEAANPWAAIIKAAIKKVVKAVDLMIQRRQNRVIKLQNAQKAIENTMAKLHLDEIADWVKKQRDLYREYYDELKKVKAVISYYFRIKQIAEKEALIVEQYQKAWALFRNDKHFSAKELAHMQMVYSGILEETVKNVDVLALVVKSFTTQMSDVKRLEIIDRAAKQVDKIYDELSIFNHENKMLSLSRAKDELDAKVVKELYGID